MAYITSSDISARLTTKQFLDLFDKDKDGVEDSNYITTCINTAESQVNMRLTAYYQSTSITGTVDEAVKSICVSLAIWEAVKFSAFATSETASPYRSAMNEAQEQLKSLALDDRFRLVTATNERPLPHASIVGEIDTNGNYNNPYSRIANNVDFSNF